MPFYPAVPWQRPYALPTATVVSAWREAIGPEPLERLRDMLLAAIDTEHQAGPETALWAALSHAGPEGASVAGLMAGCGMSRSWVYYRLCEHARAGRAVQTRARLLAGRPAGPTGGWAGHRPGPAPGRRDRRRPPHGVTGSDRLSRPRLARACARGATLAPWTWTTRPVTGKG
jgi:hypothetical protein